MDAHVLIADASLARMTSRARPPAHRRTFVFCPMRLQWGRTSVRRGGARPWSTEARHTGRSNI